MSRPEQVAEAFADLAQTLVGDFDLAEALDRVVGHCIRAAGAAGVGLVIQDGNGVLRDIAYSDERVRLLEREQVRNGEGPCVDCVRTGGPVVAEDLHAERDRWPRFVPDATQAGFLCVRALPLRYYDRTLGALNLFDRQPGHCSGASMRAAQAFADLAMLAVVQHSRPSEGAAAHINRALAGRSAIERAKGMLAQDGDLTFAEALEVLRNHAARTGEGPTQLAHALVRGDITTAAVLGTPLTETR